MLLSIGKLYVLFAIGMGMGIEFERDAKPVGGVKRLRYGPVV